MLKTFVRLLFKAPCVGVDNTSKGIKFMLLSVFGSLHIRSFTDHIWECVLCGRYSTVRFPHPFKYYNIKRLVGVEI